MFVCPECGASQASAGPCPVDGAALAPIGEDVLLGTTIGAYRVARLLGIGGMGRVYKGVHPGIGSRVAIKVLSRECSDRRDLVDRFFAEAKAVNLIRHESIVNVLDLATLPDGRPYIIMEYLDGSPLASIIDHAVEQRAPLPLGGIARLAAEVLDALAAAHAKGIVHRDLKPDNVFVAPSGRPKVLDFGIAKLSDVNNAATRTGSLLGTPHYMSPEQAAGRAVEHRADLYAIGVILFECATGRKPFLADALFDLLRMHVEVPPPSPRAFRPDMPPELEHVILTALAKSPEQRFPHAMAMSMALQHATAQLPPDAWRPLIPPSGGASASPSWVPAPPSSWSGSGAGRVGSGSGSTVPGGGPPSGYGFGPGTGPVAGQRAQQPGHVATAAHPVTRAPSSKRGLYLGLGAIVVIVGVASAAMFAGGGSGEAPSAGAGSTTASGGAPAESAAGGAQDPWAQPAANDKAGGGHAGAGDDEDGSDDSDVAQASAAAEKAMDDALKQIDTAIATLPPEQQKRLAAYKALSRLPPKERIKRMRELAAQGLVVPGVEAEHGAAGAHDDKADAKHGDKAEAEEPAEPDPLAEAAGKAMRGDEPAEKPAAIPAGAWITSHDLPSPRGYDPAHVDVSAFIPWAIAEAKRAIPDAQLIRIDVDNVRPDGRADLTLPSLASNHGSIDLRFISPSRGKRDPKQPLGVARRDFKCEFRVMAEPDGVSMMPIDFADCSKEHVVPVPKCSFTGVWKKAIARKAPSQNVVANVGYRSSGSRIVWYFDIGSGFDKVFSQTFGDDC